MYLVLNVVVGNRIGDIGAAIQEYAESFGYGCSYRLTRSWANNARRANGAKHGWRTRFRLKEGMVLTIEPMINTGTGKLIWT
ncbi:MAG: M24 family metallopeptidase [Streptococcus salivarius]